MDMQPRHFMDEQFLLLLGSSSQIQISRSSSLVVMVMDMGSGWGILSMRVAAIWI
jgi:hypothetical protein